MKKSMLILCSLLLIYSFVFLPDLYAATVVIVHPDNPVNELSRRQVVSIYLGKRNDFPNGGIALTIDQDSNSLIRQTFYKILVKKSVAQINAYWARLLFTGRATPPRLLTPTKIVIQTVAQNIDAIGYIDSNDLNERVKVVYTLKNDAQ